MSSALDDLRKLYKRIVEIAEEHSLEVAGYSVTPSTREGGHDSMRVTFLMSPESVETAEETQKRQTDDAFESMMAGLDLSEDFLTEDEKEEAQSGDKALDDAKEQFKKRFGTDQ